MIDTRIPRPSRNQLLVLEALNNSSEEMTGNMIRDAVKIDFAPLYPLLDKMVAAGWIKARWSEAERRADGRPRRRFYSLTDAGLENLNQSPKPKPRKWLMERLGLKPLFN